MVRNRQWPQQQPHPNQRRSLLQPLREKTIPSLPRSENLQRGCRVDACLLRFARTTQILMHELLYVPPRTLLVQDNKVGRHDVSHNPPTLRCLYGPTLQEHLMQHERRIGL